MGNLIGVDQLLEETRRWMRRYSLLQASRTNTLLVRKSWTYHGARKCRCANLANYWTSGNSCQRIPMSLCDSIAIASLSNNFIKAIRLPTKVPIDSRAVFSNIYCRRWIASACATSIGLGIFILALVLSTSCFNQHHQYASQKSSYPTSSQAAKAWRLCLKHIPGFNIRRQRIGSDKCCHVRCKFCRSRFSAYSMIWVLFMLIVNYRRPLLSSARVGQTSSFQSSRAHTRFVLYFPVSFTTHPVSPLPKCTRQSCMHSLCEAR